MFTIAAIVLILLGIVSFFAPPALTGTDPSAAFSAKILGVVSLSLGVMAKSFTLVRHFPVPFAIAFVATLLMGILFTVLDTVQLPEPLNSIISFVPGGVSALVLGSAGLTRRERGLRFAKVSPAGAVALAGITILMLPILVTSTSWTGWRWLPALVYAPASGMAQELYFRAALLPALERAFRCRKTTALLVHSAIFVGYHYRTFQAVPSLGLAFIVAVVLFTGGCGWGWQVQRNQHHWGGVRRVKSSNIA